MSGSQTSPYSGSLNAARWLLSENSGLWAEQAPNVTQLLCARTIVRVTTLQYKLWHAGQRVVEKQYGEFLGSSDRPFAAYRQRSRQEGNPRSSFAI